MNTLRVTVSFLFLSIVIASSLNEAWAFPPAPYYSIYGNVRDEHGQLIPANGSTVVFFYNGGEHSRYSITSLGDADFNYEIRMKMDMNQSGTSVYDSLAVNSGVAYTVAIDIGGVLHYPIEISTPPTIGNPADRRRLDLTLGADSDKDGLPDAWEKAQLFNAGLPTTDLSLISPGGDFDKDGISDRQEYLSGTYATDAADFFFLRIVSLTDQDTVVDFYGITAKTYSIESSTDMVSWAPVDFSMQAGGSKISSHVATDVGVVRAYIPTSIAAKKVFYRVKIQ
ncbi:MAG: hypothetical protein EBY32_14450 [Proteobacteria bacterium]|nr:hypothetical protein [Pseudomonadota bacterium]